MIRREHSGTALWGRRKPHRAKNVQLANKEGRKLTVTLREYRHGDEESMIACIRDEYQETYFKRDFYSPEYLKEEAESGHITFLVAQTRAGEIAGMLILKEFAPEESMCEIASQIFRKKYRGYGLAMPFFEYGMEILSDRDYSAAYCLPVLFHDITQRLLYRLGLRATGFLLNVFDVEHITHSYQNGRNTKHSQGIQIRAVEKQDAKTVYVPAEHREFCRNIYESLGVAYHMAEIQEECRKNMPPVSGVSHVQNDWQSSLEIRVSSVGPDLRERIAALHKKYPLRGRQTANILLNISDSNAVWAYHCLSDMGYFFTGLKPLCSDREYMVLHHSGEVEIFMEDYALTDEFRKLAEYTEKIFSFIKERKSGMGYMLTKTGTDGFVGRSKKIKENIIDVAVDYVKKNGVVSKKIKGEVNFRIDCTDENHTFEGNREKVIKIQVQSGSDTYSSVTIRKSAADRIETDTAIKDVIADAIEKSYLDGAAYEVSYSE